MKSTEILASWRSHISTTGKEKTQIPSGDVHSAQKVYLKKSLRLKPDSLDIEFDVGQQAFGDLIKIFTTSKDDCVELKKPLSFCVPVLSKELYNKCYHIPLFICDLPEEFLLDNSDSDDPEKRSCFEVSCSTPDGLRVNIAAFSDLLKEDLTALNRDCGFLDVVSYLTGKAATRFDTALYDLIEWIELRINQLKQNHTLKVLRPIYAIIHPLESSDFNTERELQDFNYIIGEFKNHKYPLLDHYIQNKAVGTSIINQYPVSDQNIYGLFESKYSLGLGQIQSIQLNAIDNGPSLIAVQGAPGTGKTTLFKSLIAQQIATKALDIIEGKTSNRTLLVASTAIKAVENVIGDLKDDDETNSLNWLWFHGGNKKTIEQQVNDRLKSHINNLKSENFDESHYLSVKDNIVSIKEEIDQEKYQFDCEVSNLKDVFNSLIFHSDHLQNDVSSVRDGYKKFMKDTHDRIQAVGSSEIIKSINDIIYLNDKISDEIKYITISIDDFFDAKQDLSQFIKIWPSHLSLSHLSDFMIGKKIKGKINLKFIDNFRLLYLKFLFALSPIKSHLIDKFELLYLHEKIEDLVKKNVDNILKLTMLDELLSAHQQTNEYLKSHENLIKNYGSFLWSDVLRTKFVPQHRKIFELSLSFIYQEQIKQKSELIPALECWSDLLIGHKSASFYKYANNTEFFELISMAYPVVASTLVSAYKLPGYKKLKDLGDIKPWNLVLLDEAGMVSSESLVPLLSRASSAMIVGDPLQLEPIRTLTEYSKDLLYDQFFSKSPPELYARLAPGLCTAYHRAAGALTGEVSDIGDGVMLEEHRRCQKPIADLFIDIAGYNGLIVETGKSDQRISTAFKAMGSHHLMFYNVEGLKGSIPNVNTDEVEAVGEILDLLSKAGYDLTRDIGVITPFSNQKLELIRRYSDRLDHKIKPKIGSVHQFQGVGFEVVVFSSVLFDPKDSVTFLNQKPNLLNVAVSRAKQQFIVAGNYQKLKESKGYLEILADKIASDFYLEIGQQSQGFEKAISHHETRIVYSCDHINEFERLSRSAQHRLWVISPWIRGPSRLAMPDQLKLLVAAKKRGVDVRVFYGYSSVTTANDNDENRPELIDLYQSELGSQNVIRLEAGTHEKILIMDNQEIIIGSWNWLSNIYYKYCNLAAQQKSNLNIRRETSAIISDPQYIDEYIKNLQGDLDPSSTNLPVLN